MKLLVINLDWIPSWGPAVVFVIIMCMAVWFLSQMKDKQLSRESSKKPCSWTDCDSLTRNKVNGVPICGACELKAKQDVKESIERRNSQEKIRIVNYEKSIRNRQD